MAEPDIFQVGKYQIAKVRFAGQEDQVGIREGGSHMPWTVLGDLDSVYASSTNVPEEAKSSIITYVDQSPNYYPGRVSGAFRFRDGVTLSSVTPGFAKGGEVQIFPELSGVFRYVRTGTWFKYLERAEFGVELRDLLQSWWDQGTGLWESLVPVDADASQHSEGVNYGRAV